MIHINTNLPYIGGMESCIGGRKENQDTCGYCETEYGLLLVVCDGMGGGPSGKLASSMAVNEIIEFVKYYKNRDNIYSDAEILVEAIKSANTSIYSYGEENNEFRGMGTTIVALLINDNHAVIANVGDSRCYQMRNERIIFKTQDHSVVADLVREGRLTEEQARISPNSNIITRALGLKDYVRVDVKVVSYEKKDRFYLCSDGVWGTMPENELRRQFYRYPQISNILDSTSMLVDEIGKEKGGHHDNHTLIIIETKNHSKYKTQMSTIHKRIMLFLLAFLAISLFVNTIAIFKQEQSGNNGSCIETNDSINILNSKISLLEKNIIQIKEEYNRIIQHDKKASDNQERIKILENKLDSIQKENETLKSSISKNKQVNKQKKELPDGIKEYLTYSEKKENILKAVKYLHKGSSNKTKSKNDIIRRLKNIKEDFISIGEEETYNRLIEIVEKTAKSPNIKHIKEIEEIINSILNKYN